MFEKKSLIFLFDTLKINSVPLKKFNRALLTLHFDKWIEFKLSTGLPLIKGSAIKNVISGFNFTCHETPKNALFLSHNKSQAKAKLTIPLIFCCSHVQVMW
jgi:hypothetical protein